MSQISLLLFSWEKELSDWTYLLKKTLQRTKILIPSVWNKILKTWDTLSELIKVELQCSENYFKFFLPKEAGAFGNNIQKIPQKPCPKLKKYAFCIFTENICSACNSMQMVFSCKNASILQNIDSNFLTLKLAYYPNNTIKLKHKECLYYKKTSATCKNQLGLITTNICDKVGQNSVNKCKKNAKREAFGYFRTQTYVVSNKFCYQSNSRKSNKVTSITKVRIHDTHNNIKPLLRHNLENLIYWHLWYCKFQTNKST